MTCRSCGIEIAAKALICYKCGTATTEAKYQPSAPRRSSSSSLVATTVALALLGLFALYLGRLPHGDMPRFVTWAAVWIAVLVVALRAYARRRR